MLTFNYCTLEIYTVKDTELNTSILNIKASSATLYYSFIWLLFVCVFLQFFWSLKTIDSIDSIGFIFVKDGLK